MESPMVAELATSILHRRPRCCGFLIGTGVMAVAFIAALVPLVSDPYSEATASAPAMLLISAVGYFAAIAATIGRRTRRVGQGMLLGLTTMLPVAFAGLLAANLGIIGWW
jgi:hypothetical protein